MLIALPAGPGTSLWLAVTHVGRVRDLCMERANSHAAISADTVAVIAPSDLEDIFN